MKINDFKIYTDENTNEQKIVVYTEKCPDLLVEIVFYDDKFSRYLNKRTCILGISSVEEGIDWIQKIYGLSRTLNKMPNFETTELYNQFKSELIQVFGIDVRRMGLIHFKILKRKQSIDGLSIFEYLPDQVYLMEDFWSWSCKDGCRKRLREYVQKVLGEVRDDMVEYKAEEADHAYVIYYNSSWENRYFGPYYDYESVERRMDCLIGSRKLEMTEAYIIEEYKIEKLSDGRVLLGDSVEYDFEFVPVSKTGKVYGKYVKKERKIKEEDCWSS